MDVSREQGIQIVRAVVAECLARDEEEVRAESRLVTDLGADSLDFIDLIFTLEKRFGVRIRENDLNLAAGASTDPNVEFLSPAAVSRLLPWLPELSADGDL